MRKLNWCIVLTILLSLIVLVCFYSENAQKLTPDESLPTFHVCTDETDVPVQWWDDVERTVVFLPSYAEMRQIRVEMPDSERIALGEIPLRDKMTCDAFKVGTAYPLTVNGNEKGVLQFLQSSNVATMYIDTDSKTMDAVHADKSHRERAELTILDQSGVIRYHGNGSDWIRGHGNSTWELEKKSYNLYLGESAALLGLGSAEKFVLVSNAIDDTNMRNRLVYDFAGEFGQFEGFSPNCEYVDLYLNGDYRGLYLLCEKPEIAVNRLKAAPGSYLFEMTAYGNDGRQMLKRDRGMYAEIHDPDPCSPAQRNELEEILNKLQCALCFEDDQSPAAGDSWKSVIDLDSWARKYLIEEVFANADAGFFSQYYFWDRATERIYAGPCWDYDGTLGMFEFFPNSFLARRSYLNDSISQPWYQLLWEQEAFREHVTRLYRDELKPALEKLIQETVPELSEQIERASTCNQVRWYDAANDLSASIDEMADYLAERTAFLDSAWIEGVVYHTVTLKLNTSEKYLFYCVADGASCVNLPSPRDLGADSDVWYQEDDGTIFDSAADITGDVILTAYPPADAEKGVGEKA